MALVPLLTPPSRDNPSGAVGVNMSTNPLRLAPGELHSATNMAFNEGVLRTRPGFRYQAVGVSGVFQGASYYTPSKGLSSVPFAQNNSAYVLVVSGRAYTAEATSGSLGCAVQEICGDYDFNCRGYVHIFQAEDWLIFQNPQSNTHFWNNNGCLVESPGMAGCLEDNDDACPITTLPEQDCTSFPCSGDTDNNVSEIPPDPPICETEVTEYVITVTNSLGSSQVNLMGSLESGSFIATGHPVFGTVDLKWDGSGWVIAIPSEGVTLVPDESLGRCDPSGGSYTDPEDPTWTATFGPLECSEITTYYIALTWEGEPVEYVTVTGSLIAGSFSGPGALGLVILEWDEGLESWLVTADDGVLPGVADATTTVYRCDPEGDYSEEDQPEFDATVSETPLP